MEVKTQKEDPQVSKEAGGTEKPQSNQCSMQGLAAKNRYKLSVRLKKEMFFIFYFERT